VIQNNSKSSMSIPLKHVTSACYDKQHFYVRRPIAEK